jgi:hypothetical protein
MRAALKGTSEAATLVGRTEAATVLFEASANTLASPAEAQTVMKGSETTVVRSQSGPGKRRIAPWAIGAATVVLVGVLFGGFYAFQHRNNSNAATAPSDNAQQAKENAVTSEPSPPANQAATEPNSGSLNEVKKVVVPGHPSAVDEPAKKSEKTAKNNAKAGEKRASPGGNLPEPALGAGEHPDLKNAPVPNMPEIIVPDASQPNGRDLRRMGVPTTRTFPDGTQVMTLSDGTRIVTFPNGTKRVFGPGQRVVRRKGLR